MPITKNNGGDVLARGGVRANFGPAERKLTDKQFDAMFEGFDPKAFVMSTTPKVAGAKEATRRNKK